MLAEFSGRLSERPPVDLLQLCEQRRFSGDLEFFAARARGKLRILGGFVEGGELEGQPGDAIDAFLGLEDGRFRLRQRVPTPDGAWIDESMCSGPIGPHLPAELLRFCESTGLTGRLTLASGGRHVEVAYRGGEIDSISLDGQSEEDLREAWGWASGEWSLSWEPFIEPQAPRRPDETGRQFLAVVEQTLSKILAGAQDALPPPRRESLVAAVKRRADDTASRRLETQPLVPSREPSRSPREPTVRIYYLRDLVPQPVVERRGTEHRTIRSRTDFTEELVDVPEGIRVGELDSPTAPAEPRTLRPPSPWPYLVATLVVAAATALVLWLLG